MNKVYTFDLNDANFDNVMKEFNQKLEESNEEVVSTTAEGKKLIITTKFDKNRQARQSTESKQKDQKLLFD